jgi:hypothetical protein
MRKMREPEPLCCGSVEDKGRQRVPGVIAEILGCGCVEKNLLSAPRQPRAWPEAA